MSDERIDIEIQDKISSDISIKLTGIATTAREANTAVSELKRELASIKATGLNALKTALNNGTAAINNNALASQKLQQAQAKTAIATAKLQMAQAKTNAAQTMGAVAAQRLATAQQQTAAAANRAALAQARLQQAHNRTALSAAGAGAGIKSFLMNAAAIAGVTVSATAIIALADSYTTLQNKLKVVGESETGVGTMTNALFEIANRTRVAVEETSASFVRFDLALKQLGASQEESLRLTETINKSLIVSGATTSEAANALLQLGQAFNKGKLDGDEFRSVMEQMPLAADAIAKELKTVRGNLLNLAPTGVITTQVMRKAFAAVADEIDKKFAKTIPTIGQSLVTMKNRFIQAFGEMNKSLGVTRMLATAFKFIGEHIREALAVLALLGIAMLAVFGPAIVGMIGTATSAVWAFGVALAMNPIGLIAVGLGAVIAGIALYGDQIKIAEDSTITLKDVALGSWDVMKTKFEKTASDIQTAWAKTTNFIGEQIDKILYKLETLTKKQWVPDVVKVLGLTVAGVVSKGMFGTNIFAKGGEIDQIKQRAKERADARLKEEKDKKAGLRGTGTSIIPPAVDKAAVRRAFEIDKLSRTLDEELQSLQNLSAEEQVNNEIMKLTNNLLDKKIKLNSIEIAGFREKLQLIQDQKSQNEADNIKDRLNDELSALQEINSERKDQLRLSKIENDFAKKKLNLSKENLLYFQNQVRMISFEKSKNEVSTVKDELNDRLEVLKLSKEQRTSEAMLNKIENERFTKKGLVMQPSDKQEIKSLLDEVQITATADALEDVNIELRQQSQLLDAIGPQREIEQQMQQYENDFRQKGIILSNEEAVKIREKLGLLQKQSEVSREVDAIYNETKGAQEQLRYQVEALNIAYKDGLVTLDQYGIRLTKLAVEYTNLKIQMGQGDFNDVALASLGSLIENYKGLLSGLNDSFKGFFDTLNNGFADSIGRAIVYADNLGEALIKVGQEAVAGLISALVKLGIQWALQAILGKTIAASSMAAATAMSTAAAATTATAWAPAASFVSLATFGANSVGAMAAIGATTALTEGLAATSLFGFKEGGFTGNVGTSEIAGFVHGKEFVMNAGATAANRPTLEAMNKGEKVGANVNVSIENYGTSKEFDVQHIDENTIRIIARDEAKSAVYQHAPGVIANDLGNSNSRTSKAIGRNTESRRRR
jgi:tape measure domain-containing protein